MFRNNRIKAFCLTLPILSLVMLSGCAGSKSYEGSITEFSYHYGSFFCGYYEYDIASHGVEVHFTAIGMNGVELDIDKEVDSSILEELSSVITNNHLEKWDGFSKSDDNVMDGYGFTLIVKFDDGRTLTVDGYEKYPKNYEKVHEALVEVLESVE